MSNSITIPVNNSSEALAFVGELKAAGLQLDRDYTWSYQPKINSVFDYMLNDVVEQTTITFRFVDASLASFYQLKWL